MTISGSTILKKSNHASNKDYSSLKLLTYVLGIGSHELSVKIFLARSSSEPSNLTKLAICMIGSSSASGKAVPLNEHSISKLRMRSGARLEYFPVGDKVTRLD